MSSIDRYSLTTVHLELSFQATLIGPATGFFWEYGHQRFLITNWHCFSGRDVFSRRHLSPTLIEPDKVKLAWPDPRAITERQSIELAIRDDRGMPLWQVHPVLGSGVDVAALPVAHDVAPDVPSMNSLEDARLSMDVGMDVFVLGYPYGMNSTGLPIWKRASLASEPHVMTTDQRYRLIDTASRPGMSGSPVIRRSWGFHALADGNFMGGMHTMTAFVGVYSGRLAARDPLDAQLGIVWPSELLIEVIALGGLDDGGDPARLSSKGS